MRISMTDCGALTLSTYLLSKIYVQQKNQTILCGLNPEKNIDHYPEIIDQFLALTVL